MSDTTILVQMSETRWTMAALEVAAQQARGENAQIALVEFLSCDCLGWKGLQAEEYRFSESERDDIDHYRQIAADYGVTLKTYVYEYNHLEDAITRAADELKADSVYVNLPPDALPFLHQRRVKHLSAVLEAHHHHLYTVEPPAVMTDWTPTATEQHPE